MKVYICYTSDGYEWDIDTIFAKEEDAKSYCEYRNKSLKHWEQLDYFEQEVQTDGIIF